MKIIALILNTYCIIKIKLYICQTIIHYLNHSIMHSEKQKNIVRHVDHAIWYWEEKLKGTKFWWDENEYSQEWIISQIKYFKEFKSI